jgi:hypothetical protein
MYIERKLTMAIELKSKYLLFKVVGEEQEFIGVYDTLHEVSKHTKDKNISYLVKEEKLTELTDEVMKELFN